MRRLPFRFRKRLEKEHGCQNIPQSNKPHILTDQSLRRRNFFVQTNNQPPSDCHVERSETSLISFGRPAEK